jgi:hypothetical protein
VNAAEAAEKAKQIHDAAEVCRVAVDLLQALLLDNCPGPHSMEFDPDLRRPWCHACGYQIDGYPVEVQALPQHSPLR